MGVKYSNYDCILLATIRYSGGYYNLYIICTGVRSIYELLFAATTSNNEKIICWVYDGNVVNKNWSVS